MFRYIIYNVSKEEYDSCRISQTDPRVVAVCDKPDRQLQFTITFRWDSPFYVLALAVSKEKPRQVSLQKLFSQYSVKQTVSPSSTNTPHWEDSKQRSFRSVLTCGEKLLHVNLGEADVKAGEPTTSLWVRSKVNIYHKTLSKVQN